MIILGAGTTDKLQLVTSSAANVDAVTSFVDNNSGAVTPGVQGTTIAAAATTDICAAPGASTYRAVVTVNIRNRHAATANTVTVQQVIGASTFELIKVTLAAGQSLQWVESVGWGVYDATGAFLTTMARPSIQLTSPANPALTASTTGVMMGNAVAFTPTNTGRVLVTVTGMAKNSVVGDGTSAQLRFGTGGAPANGAALTGTTAGVYKNMIASTAAGVQGFAISVIITTLTVGTAYWFDLAVKAVTGGNATVQDLDYSIVEI